ncbi:ABC transporter substrate-binding protein [Filimonas lacunae]|nr:helical backbone metal receptor [Filimonas lacunae]
MSQYTDQLGRTVMQLHAPQRIVSLVPSLTELLYTLQLEQEVVGITRFCIHPSHWRQQKANIGGTKQVHVQQVQALQPHLVIASKEENIKEQVEDISSFAAVWVSDINNYHQALDAILSIGEMCNKQQAALQLVTHIQQQFAEISTVEQPMSAAYLIWKDPYMTVGGDTFIHDMMQRCGLQNIFSHCTRYPTTTVEELQQSSCQVVILSSEPYPFREKHLADLQQQLPGKKIILANGEMFSWYGSRMLQAPAYFIGLLQRLQQG